MASRGLLSLLAAIALCSALGLCEEPKYYETLGRILIKIESTSGAIYEYPTSFEEVYDFQTQRARVSIGNIGYDQRTYLSTKNGRMITAEDGRACQVSEHPVELVPELSWFAGMFLDPKLKYVDSCIGPTCMFKKFEGLCPPESYKLKETDEKSQSLLTKTCDSNKDRIELTFTLRKSKNETIYSTDKLSSAELQHLVQATVTITRSDSPDLKRATFHIKWYDITPFGLEWDLMEQKFLKPFGCGKFLDSVSIAAPSKTFSLLMRQHSNPSPLMIAYDHEHSLLRRESGGSTKVWDIRNEMLYNIDGENPNRLSDRLESSVCSVMNVAAEKRVDLRPYNEYGNSFVISDFFASTYLHYMGESLAKGKPCYVYEFQTNVAPPIFSVNDAYDQETKKPSTARYTVQLLVARGERSNKVDPEHLKYDRLFPLEIRLHKATESGEYKLEDVIEILEFHWSLDGWRRKPAEMFMAQECFTTNEHMKLETVIKLDEIHEQKISNLSDVINAGGFEPYRGVLSHNKFRFEDYIINFIFQYFKKSKLHMIDYELNFRPHHAQLSITVSDLEYYYKIYPEGMLSTSLTDCAGGMCAHLQSGSHEECLSYGSLVKSVNYVAYCPMIGAGHRCLVYHEAGKPEIVDAKSDKLEVLTCEVHRFERSPAEKAIPNFRTYASALPSGFWIDFEAKIPDKSSTVKLKGTIESYDVSEDSFEHALAGHRYLVPDQSTWLGDGLVDIKNMDTVGDCRKMCNLDVECRSFSFCPGTRGDPPSCVISTLDFEEAFQNSSNIKHEDLYSQIIITLGSRTFKLQNEVSCETYLRDYLSLFAAKQNVIRIPKIEGSKFPKVKSAGECARQAILSESDGSEHASVFAFCAQTDSCIVKSLNEINALPYGDEIQQASIDQEMLCTVYRRQYHTLFHVSTPVVVAPSFGDQDSLHLLTAEECAHACWNDFGDACHSFDFCDGDNGCKINKISTSDASLAPKSGCLHYERDLKLDHVRREYLIGRHQLLVTGGFSFRQLIMFSFLLVPMAIGLLIGSRTDGRLAIPSGSILSGLRLPSLISSPLFGSSSSPPSRILSGEEKNYDDGTDGIQMSYINESYGADNDALANDF